MLFRGIDESPFYNVNAGLNLYEERAIESNSPNDYNLELVDSYFVWLGNFSFATDHMFVLQDLLKLQFKF